MRPICLYTTFQTYGHVIHHTDTFMRNVPTCIIIKQKGITRMARTLIDVIRIATDDYLSQLDLDNLPPPQQISADIMTAVEQEIQLERQQNNAAAKWKVPTKLGFYQVGSILMRIYSICRIATGGVNSDPSYDLLAVYQTSGRDEGLYCTDEEEFRRLARAYDYSITKRECDELLVFLRDFAPRTERCKDPDLIPVNNGIFNYKTKILEPFTPEHVFLSKSHINYNPVATNVNIHNTDDGTDWNVEDWMKELSNDPEIIQLLWEILGAIIRPFVNWDKSAWFYSEAGNNGKGTLCELMRQLCGEGTYASIPLADMGKDFMLEPLTRAAAIIVDENDVGTYIDKAANLKAIITNDVLAINRKFKSPIAYQFYGFMVQCLNEMPRVKDKSDSFFRRQLFVPFTKCFTGKERKYIKHDYLHRPEVLEYVLYKVLHMDYYQLSCPESCKLALEEYREYNDPIRQFVDEILSECVWDLLPFTFLYDLYQAWMKATVPSGTPLARNTFIKDLLITIQGNDIWECPDKNAKIKISTRMDLPEPLIKEYQLKGWMNPRYIGSDDISKLCHPPQKAAAYRGLTRIPGAPAPTPILTDDE